MGKLRGRHGMIDNILYHYENKRVFVTGHTGFKGSWLCSILLMLGAQVYGYALKPDTDPSLFELLGLERRMNSVLADIRDFESLSVAMHKAKPDIVFHLAAQPLVRLSYKEPVETFSTNILGTVNLLEAVRNTKGVKGCVIITTDKVYEENLQPMGYKESDRLGGSDPYSASKACSELVAKSYRESFFGEEGSTCIATARAGNVIGGGDYATDRIIPDCIRAAKRKETIFIRNPYSIRPWQHVLEPLAGYLALALKLEAGDRDFCSALNFGPYRDDSLTTGELASVFCGCWGENLKWEHSGELKAPHESVILKLNITKAMKTLGWTPKLTITQAVGLVVKWEKSYNKLTATENQIKEYFGL